MASKRILSAGQCQADHGRITGSLKKTFDIEVVAVDSHEQALEKCRQEPFALVLINRIFDADGSSGLELIKQMKADPQTQQTPVMLVSNYDDAQAEAVDAGAALGFGKGELGERSVIERVEAYLR
jgi:two-component system chemotaxis response regulator CheY